MKYVRGSCWELFRENRLKHTLQFQSLFWLPVTLLLILPKLGYERNSVAGIPTMSESQWNMSDVCDPGLLTECPLTSGIAVTVLCPHCRDLQEVG